MTVATVAKEVIMPKFGFTQESAEIVRWLKRAGDSVEQGEPIAEVTTDKVNMEVEAPAAGILDGLRFAEGDTVPVTEIIAYIRAANDTLPSAVETTSLRLQRVVSAPATEETRATPVAQKMAQDKGVDLSGVPGSGIGGRITKLDVERYLTEKGGNGQPVTRVAAVPAARRLARELGVDLAAIEGTGPRGRVQSDDVRAAWAAGRMTEDEGRKQAAPKPSVVRRPSTVIPLAGMRRTIAQRLQKSFQESPHIFFDAEIDVTEAEQLRSRANERLGKDQPKVSLTAIIAKACAWALGRNPMVNARIEGDDILLLDEINLGIAVALEASAGYGGGLIVPVVRDVPHKGLAQLAMEIADFAQRARANHLRPDDVADGTFTVSNLGMFGVDRFTAIINPPQAAILAVSRVRRQFVPDANDQPVVRPLMTVTLSADHRLVDGAVAARFMKDLRDGLEQPALMMI
ncbi:MAG: dihydrolipoamide acetyltransferase family protein [Anaerolineales bacterium]